MKDTSKDKPVVHFRPLVGAEFTVEKTTLRAYLRHIKPFLERHEEEFIRHAIKHDLPNPVAVGTPAKVALMELVAEEYAVA